MTELRIPQQLSYLIADVSTIWVIFQNQQQKYQFFKAGFLQDTLSRLSPIIWFGTFPCPSSGEWPARAGVFPIYRISKPVSPHERLIRLKVMLHGTSFNVPQRVDNF